MLLLMLHHLMAAPLRLRGISFTVRPNGSMCMPCAL